MDLDVYGLNEADQIRSLVDPSGTILQFKFIIKSTLHSLTYVRLARVGWKSCTNKVQLFPGIAEAS